MTPEEELIYEKVRHHLEECVAGQVNLTQEIKDALTLYAQVKDSLVVKFYRQSLEFLKESPRGYFESQLRQHMMNDLIEDRVSEFESLRKEVEIAKLSQPSSSKVLDQLTSDVKSLIIETRKAIEDYG